MTEQMADRSADRRLSAPLASRTPLRGAIVLLASLTLISGACTANPSSPSSPNASPTPVPVGSPSAPSAANSPAASPTPSVRPDLAAIHLALRRVARGFSSPVYVADAGDASGRLYVVEQGGRIRIVNKGAVRTAPFLDISSLVTAGGERGLLSVAFAPDYLTSGRFYVDYTNRSGNTVIARYLRSTSGSTADPSSARTLLTVQQPYANHNGGLVLFGPDGQLYIGMGDGGSAGDPQNNAQNGATLLGKLLRIDVSGNGGYAIPSDNPFIGNSRIRDEIWALGLRNPWRFSFDRETGDLWIGDVGQNEWEEVDFQAASSPGGQNYGWRRMEGPACYSGSCDPSKYVAPVTAYAHGKGDCAIVGGYVYRGTAFPELGGVYLYGDDCSGRIWGLVAADGSTGTARPRLLLDSPYMISSFGEDRNGELYLTDLVGGGLYQVVRAP